MIRVKKSLAHFAATTAILIAPLVCNLAQAAGIKVVPSVQRVHPGENFYFDVKAEGIPAEGLGAVQFRVNVNALLGTVKGVADVAQGGAGDISVSSPLLVSPPTATRSGIGEFFWNGKGPNGILILENETIANGSGLYTFGHTNGSVNPSGSGSVARFVVNVGKNVQARDINISLSDVMLLDGGPAYSLDYNQPATVQIGCFTTMPSLMGLGPQEATALLAQRQLVVGNIYEIDNSNGLHQLNKVLEQSVAAGVELECETPVNFAVNTPPGDVMNLAAADKVGDDTGRVVLTWTPATSQDVAGYRVYRGGNRVAEVANPTASGLEVGGLSMGVASQLVVKSYDAHNNEAAGVTVSVTAVDDVPPSIAITGVEEGVHYKIDVAPQVVITDTNLSSQSITLNGAPYDLSPVTADGSYMLVITAGDGTNTTARTVHFTVDKTAPVITVPNVVEGRFYNADITPAISVLDANLKTSLVALNSVSYTPGTTLSAEGSYTLTITAEDMAGNSSSFSVNFGIDKTLPVSTIATGDPKYLRDGKHYIVAATPLTITATDPGTAPSGIERIEYRIDQGGAWNAYAAPITFTGYADGEYSVSYRAVDRATNIESNHFHAVTVDNSPPVTTLTVGNPKHQGPAGLFVTAVTTFELSAADSGSGVAGTEYRIDDGSWTVYAPFIVTGEGTHTVLFRSTDNLGNVEGEKALVVAVDSTPPVTEIAVGTPKYEADGKLYVSGTTSFTLSGADTISGIKITEYRIDNGEWKPYAPFTLSTEGEHTISFRSVDNVGNVEAEKTKTVIIDINPPVTTLTVGEPKHEGQGVTYVTGNTRFSLSAADLISGVATIEYRIGNGEWTSYAPFTIGVEGEYVVAYRSTDNLGHVEAEKTVTIVVDNTAPETAITVGDPKHDAENKKYISGTTPFTLTAADNLSGVAKTEYRIDEGEWTAYAPFTIPSEGEHSVSFRSADNLGNVETVKILTVIVDTTPPVSSITVGEPKHSETDGKLYVSGTTQFTIAASDNLSGVRKTEYRIEGGEWTAYVPFAIASEGEHTIGFRSIDNVGHTETEKKLVVVVDNTPPVTSISVSTPKYEAEKLYVNSTTAFALAATDQLSGVAKTEYSIDGGSWTAYVPFAIPTEGEHTIIFRSFDNLGHGEQEKTLVVVVDNTPPVTSIAVGDPKYDGTGKLFVSGAATFTLSAVDNLSGVAKTEYRIDGGDWAAYAPFTIPSEGEHIIVFRSIDNLGQAEAEKSLVVIVDNTPPITAISVGNPKHDAEGKLYITGSVTFNLSATDNLSGVAKTEYRINGGNWTVYAPFTIPAEGDYTIGFRSYDNLGHMEAEKALFVVVDNTAPVTSMQLGSPTYTENETLFVSGRTPVTLTAVDPLSGVRRIEYRFDGESFSTYEKAVTFDGLRDGAHTFSYRSVDNVDNVEKEQSLAVTVDKTPPVTTISASDELVQGVLNTVSPSTIFSLKSIDNLSGVAKTWYRIDGGDWQLYKAGFALDGLKAGRHTIAFSSIDNVENAEIEQTIELRLITMEVKKRISIEPIVLVGAWCDAEMSLKKEPDVTWVAETLKRHGIRYQVAENSDDFKNMLRSGMFNTYFLIDVKSQFGHEIREAANFGDSVFFIKTSPNADPVLDEIFGLKFTGKSTDADIPIYLKESPLTEVYTLQNVGKIPAGTVTAPSLTVFGTAADRRDNYPVLTFNPYGRGKVLLAAFDLANTPDMKKREELLVQGLKFLQPERHFIHPFVVVPLRIDITNGHEPFALQVRETIDAGTSSGWIVPEPVNANNPVVWESYLGADSSISLSYLLNLPNRVGEFMTNTDVRFANYGVYRPYGSHSLSVSVPYDVATLLVATRGEIEALRQMVDNRERAALTEVAMFVAAVVPEPSSSVDAQVNIDNLIKAIERAKTVSGAEDIRLKLDELLKAMQRQWYTLKNNQK